MNDIYRTGRPSTTRVTVLHSASEPPTTSSQVSVDSIHSMIRSAETGDTRHLFAFYRDIVLAHSHLQAEFTKRKLAVLGDRLRISAADKKQSADLAAADTIRDQLVDHPGWIPACAHLLDATLYPVAVVEKVFRLEGTRYVLDQLVPVPHHLLDFREGRMRIQRVDATHGRATNEYVEADPVSYIVHRGHLLSYPDNFGGPFRSLVFWFLLSALGKDWWARFLDKYGSPFLVGKYPEANDESRTILESAFAWATRIGGLVISSDTEVEIKQAAANDSGEAYKTFLEVANREMSKLILGQTLSADAQATGMGSGVADQQAEVRNDFKQWDALRLAYTIRTQLTAQILVANNLPGAISLAWGSISVGEQQSRATLIAALRTAGWELDDESAAALSEDFGFGLRRAAPPTFGAPSLFSASAPEDLDQLIDAAAAPLAQGIRGRYAAIRRMLRESKTPEQFTADVRALFATKKDPLPGLAPTLTTAAAAAFLQS